MKKMIIWSLSGFLGLVFLAALFVFLFIKISPQFGGTATAQQKKEYEKTGYFKNNKFQNIEEFSLNLDCHSVTQMFKKMLKGNPKSEPKKDLIVIPFKKEGDLTATRITWLGHSSFYIEMKGKTFLLDPVFSQYAAPHPLLGKKRYNSKMPMALEDLDQIDYVLISHDHYDHLDYDSIIKIKDKTSYFLVPLGVGNHLKRWGVSSKKIVELAWWDEKSIGSFEFAFTPTKHMSGRGLNDQKATLWGSWVIKNKEEKIFFSGDSGYGSHFKDIGDKYGPFDISLLENGQYDELWPNVHMMPEQTVQAAIDLKSKLILPIHWGSFTLANHSWTDPIERIMKEASRRQVAITTPKIGESFELNKTKAPSSKWWLDYL